MAADDCLCYRKDNNVTELIFLHVDDPILCSTLGKAKHFVDNVQKKFKIKELEIPTEVLGIHLRKDLHEIQLSMKKSEDKVIEEYEVSSTDVLSTPLLSALSLPPTKMGSGAVVIDKYRIFLGKLLYLSRCVKYDIHLAVNFRARYASNHNKTLGVYSNGILKYLKENDFEIS